MRPWRDRVRNRLILLAHQWDRPKPLPSDDGDPIDRQPPKEYPQLWTFNVGLRVVYPRLAGLLRVLCWVLVGHELSKTEWGYGGGQCADRWCRWCNKRIRVQKESLYDEFGPTKISDMMGIIDKQPPTAV